MKIYLFSGLGADQRLFQFLDLNPHELIPIKWPPPEKNESMSDYANRLLPQITSENPVLLGVSFGGMMAVEVSKLIATKKVILVSSSPSSDYIRLIYKWAGVLRVNRLVSGSLMKKSHRLMNSLFAVSGNTHRQLLGSMLKDTNENFLEWAIEKVVTWKNKTIPSNMIRIHGTRDIVLPARGSDYFLKGGGHLIVADRAKEVGDLILRSLTGQKFIP